MSSAEGAGPRASEDDADAHSVDRDAAAPEQRSGTAAATVVSDATHTVAVVGNPNAGKTSLFNRLTGLSQKVGNYPGVTVERKEGYVRDGRSTLRLIDLPGTYSLAAHSPDEWIAVDVLLGHMKDVPRPDLILCVVDASNLDRNLYLLSQVLELDVPVLLVLNMVDVARRSGVEIRTDILAERFGVQVVTTQGNRGLGVPRLREILIEACTHGLPPRDSDAPELSRELEQEIAELGRELEPAARRTLGRSLHRFELLRSLVDRTGEHRGKLEKQLGAELTQRADAALARLKETEEVRKSGGLPALEAQARYRWIHAHLEGCVQETDAEHRRASERIDSVLTHPVWGLLVFVAVLLLLFQSIFSWAAPLMDLIDGSFGWLGETVGAFLPEGVLRSLVVDGIIGGVGGVIIFLPQILILFLLLGLLEDCGYMARAAFLMDRVMSRCGLSGKSFIPMLSGFACAIPGIMATRVIEDRRDRVATILITPLMTCSARIPVYTILIGTFIPARDVLGGFLGLQGLTMFSLYALGILVAVAVAWVLKKTLLRGETPPFLMELPSYKMPSLHSVLLRLLDRARAFLVRAGTIILAISIIVWALGYFPRSSEITEQYAAERDQVAQSFADASPEERAAQLADVDQREAGALLRASYLGRMGRAVEPVFAPLGWDWRISMAAIASFPAREVIVATLGTIYNLGDEQDDESESLRARLREATWEGSERRVFTVPVALSILVFFALCCQCGATVATIRRETNSWGWAWFTFGYMTVLAYLGALAVYQIGTAWFT